MTAVPPDTRLCREATELVREASAEHLFNHCLRSWHFAALLAERDGVAHDAEVLYLGTIMHDIGLVHGLHEPVRFEVTGANHATAQLTERGLEPERAAIVWDLIALHTSVGIAEHKGPEVALAHMGISVDVVGRWVEQIAPEELDAILAIAPRAGFDEDFLPLIGEHVAANPHVSLFNWMDSVARVHCPGHVSPAFTDIFAANPVAAR
jgi:HD domain-containing protein